MHTDFYGHLIKGYLPQKSSKARNFKFLQNTTLASLDIHDCQTWITSSEEGKLKYFFMFTLKSAHSTTADWNRLIAQILKVF